MSRSYIHTVKASSFSVGGTSYDVSAIDMTLMPNSLPMIKVSVAPQSGSKTASSAGTSKIHKLSLSSLSSALGELIQASGKNETANLSFTMSEVDAATGSDTGREQSINISGWILIGAGLGNVTTTNSFAIECTIAHPVYKLMMHGGFFSNVVKLPKFPDSLAGGDPIEVGRSAFELIHKAMSGQEKYIPFTGASITPAGKGGMAILNDVESLFAGIPGIMKEVLLPGIPGLPLAKYVPSLAQGLRVSIGNAWVDALRKGGSVWDALMDITTLFGLWMLPDYTQKALPVVPAFPWLSPSFTISEDDGYNISFPGVDPNPIYGVSGIPEADGGLISLLSTYTNTESENTGKCSGMLAFVPQSGANINGAFASVSYPAWLQSMMHVAAGLIEQGLNTFSTEELPPNTASSGNNRALCEINDARMAYLSYMFSIFFKRKLEASVACPLMFTSGGSAIIPGNVAKFVSADGSTLFQGMLVSVTHHVDAASGYGSTSLHFGWCQGKEEYEAVSGYKHESPLYS